MLGSLLAREMVRIESYSPALHRSQPTACYDRIQSLAFLAKAHQLTITTLSSHNGNTKPAPATCLPLLMFMTNFRFCLSATAYGNLMDLSKD